MVQTRAMQKRAQATAAAKKTKKTRCRKGFRHCSRKNTCVAKNSTRRTKRCEKGTRQCADRNCYHLKGHNLRTRR